jgi:hypothetical protein
MSWANKFTVLRALLVKIRIGSLGTGTRSPSLGDDPGDHKNDIRTTRGKNGTLDSQPLCL